MAKRCQITGITKMFGNRVSHANNKRRHAFLPNLQSKRIYVPELNRYIRLKVSTRALRTIDKVGLVKALRKYGREIQLLGRRENRS